MARSLGRWTLALDGCGALPSRELIGGKAWSIKDGAPRAARAASRRRDNGGVCRLPRLGRPSPRFGGRFGTNDDELLLRALVPEADLQRMRAAGPLQRDFPLVTARELEEAARLMRVRRDRWCRCAWTS